MLLVNTTANNLQDCIEACIRCAQVCNRCFKECLDKDNINGMKEALGILVDCAEMCYVTAAYLSNNNVYSGNVSGACAELCERCADICESYATLSCRDSVEACRLCAAECRKVSGG